MPIFRRRLVAPMGEDVLARGGEKGGIGTADRIDRRDSSCSVDGQSQPQSRFFGRELLLLRIGAASARIAA